MRCVEPSCFVVGGFVSLLEPLISLVLLAKSHLPVFSPSFLFLLVIDQSGQSVS